MASGKLTISIGLEIPQETVDRCLRILEMYMDDNPDLTIACERISKEDGIRYKLRIMREQEAE